MRQRDGQRHQLRRLVARVAEHHPLIAGALFLVGARVDAHGDLGRLLLDGDEHRAALRVESHRPVGVADAFHRAPHHARVIERGARCDLADQHDEAGLDRRLERHATGAVLADALVQHGVRNLIAHLVGMAFGHRFGAEQRVA